MYPNEHIQTAYMYTITNSLDINDIFVCFLAAD